MASRPSDVRWPPGDDVSMDGIYNSLIGLKQQHFPEHTARDAADPMIQILMLIASVSQHAYGRMNRALLQLNPKTATSRRALIAMLELVNRPLRPIQPSRGPVFARVKAALVSGQTLASVDQRLSPQGSIDPVFSLDEDVVTPTTTTLLVEFYDSSAGTTTPQTSPYSLTIDDGDQVMFSFEELAFTTIVLTMTTAIVSSNAIWEFYSDESGEPDGVEDTGGGLKFTLDTYLFINQVLDLEWVAGLEVTFRHKPTDVSETVLCELEMDGPDPIIRANTSLLGQGTPSTSVSDYEVTAVWRPIPTTHGDNTIFAGTNNAPSHFKASGTITFDPAWLFNEDVRWAQDATGRYKLRARFSVGGSPEPVAFTCTSTDGTFYAIVGMTQGYRQTTSIGQGDSSSFQFIAYGSDPIEEPVFIPKIGITVGGDTTWTVVDDFSNSDSTSKHALFREDVDDGWGVIFGDGSVGELPGSGSAVKMTIRTGSIQPGDLDPDATIRALGGLNKLDTWTVFRGTTGFQAPEASDRASALRFRTQVIPQLALRAESAITRDELVTAMTGGAPNRATFSTSDGRYPFSRALFSLEGAGDRQYRIVVVGPETDSDGGVDVADLVEAATWLNGELIGVEVVGGHGPNNTEAVLDSFIARSLLPTITITATNIAGLRDLATTIVKAFFRPHARDEDEEFRWKFGGRVPMPVLFGLLWSGIPSRTFITISTTDGVTTYDTGDSVDLNPFELPTLDPAFDPDVNIILVEG